MQEFHTWAEAFAATPPSQRPTLIADGLNLAAERRPVIAALIQSDPRAALRHAVPLRLRQQLPPEILAQLEERVAGRGDFEVIASVPPPDMPRDPDFRPIDRYVRFKDRTYYAHVYGRRVGQISRQNISVHGIALDGQMAVHEDPVRAIEPGEIADPNLPVANVDEICGISGLPSGRIAAAQVGDELVYLCAPSHVAEYNQQLIAAESSMPSPSWTIGMKTVLFMRLHFSDHLQESISEADAISTMHSASNWFFQFSYGLTSLKATVTPLLMMPQTKAYYMQNSGSLLQDARDVARARGFDTANFDLDCVHYPYVGGAEGVAVLGGKGVWFQGSLRLSIAVHEFGHNLGLAHAHAWKARNDTIIGEGEHIEYGNLYDVMGSGQTVDAHFNAWEKHRLGWLPDRHVATIRTSGVYRLHAFDTPRLNSNLPYACKISKDGARSYWLEYRNRDLLGLGWFRLGLLINLSPVETGTHLLDMLPGEHGLEAPLLIGRTFTDPFAGFHLTPLRVDTNATAAFIEFAIHFGEAPSNRPPIVTLSASPPPFQAGDVITFTATANDPDGDPLAYYWHFSDYWRDLAIGNGPVITKQFLTDGDYFIRCTVSDMHGGISSANRVIRVGSNSLHRISGFVRAGATPLEGVRVSNQDSHAYTDPTGRYVLVNMRAGNYTLEAFKPGWSFTPSSFNNPLNVNDTVTNINFAATLQTYTLSGRVFSGETLWPSVAIPDALVTVGTNSVLTDTNGNYSVSNLSPGLYSVTASKAGYELRAAPWWRNPVSLTWANAENVHLVQPFYKFRGSVKNVSDYVIVGADGQQMGAFNPAEYFVEVPRGLWNLIATSGGYTIVPENFSNPIEATNQPPDSVSYNFVATPGTSYAIRGTVTEAGQPLSGARITAGQRSGGSDTFGNYVLPGLPNGTYTVSATHPAYSFIPPFRSAVLNNADLLGVNFMANPIFRLTQPRATPEGFEFNLIGGTNRVFRIQYSTNDMASWRRLLDLTNSTGHLIIVDPSPISTRRFYRAFLP